MDEERIHEEPIPHGSTISSIIPSKEGHTFLNWSYENTTFNMNSSITQPIKLVASFEINQYHVNYYDNGTLVETQTANYLEALEYPIFTKEGHTFIGFKDHLNQDVSSDAVVTKNMTLSAVYQVNHYQLIFIDENNGPIGIYQVPYLSSLSNFISPNAPVKANYSFERWSQTLPDLMPASDITLSPIYIQNVNTIDVFITIKVMYEDGTSEEITIPLSDLETLNTLIKDYEIIWPNYYE